VNRIILQFFIAALYGREDIKYLNQNLTNISWGTHPSGETLCCCCAVDIMTTFIGFEFSFSHLNPRSKHLGACDLNIGPSEVLAASRANLGKVIFLFLLPQLLKSQKGLL
jgi:hypothetical protein